MAIKPIANVIDDAQSNVIAEVMLAEIEQTAGAKDNNDSERNVVEHVRIFLLKKIIKHASNQKRNHAVSCAISEHADDAQHKVRPDIGLQKRQ